MAPAKRAAPGTLPSLSVKRGKIDAEEVEGTVRDKQLLHVMKVIDTSENTESSRELLRIITRGSLAEPQEAWHPYQKAAALMMREVFHDLEEGHQHGIEAAMQTVKAAEGSHKVLLLALKSAQVELANVGKQLTAAKECWCSQNLELSHAAQAEVKASEATSLSEKALNSALAPRRTLEEALTRHLPALMTHSSAPEPHIKGLLEILVSLPGSLEESLVRAACTAGRLKPEARGSFDRAALDQLRESLEKQIEASPAAAEEQALLEQRRAEEAEAKEGRLASDANMKAVAESLRDAELRQASAEADESRAEEAVTGATEAISKAARACEEAESRLAAFRAQPLASMEALLQEPAIMN